MNNKQIDNSNNIKIDNFTGCTETKEKFVQNYYYM